MSKRKDHEEWECCACQHVTDRWTQHCPKCKAGTLYPVVKDTVPLRKPENPYKEDHEK